MAGMKALLVLCLACVLISAEKPYKVVEEQFVPGTPLRKYVNIVVNTDNPLSASVSSRTLYFIIQWDLLPISPVQSDPLPAESGSE